MSKYFIKEPDRIEAARKAAGLLNLEMRRRHFLKMSAGAGFGLAGLATIASQCGGSSGGGAEPTATTAVSAPTSAPTIAPAAAPTATSASTTATSAATAVSSGAEIVAQGVPVVDNKTSYPYGGSGIADKAIDGAKGISNKATIGLVHDSASKLNFEPFIPEWKAATGIDIKLLEIPVPEMYEKIMQGAVIKEATWDVIAMNPRAYGDLEGAGALVDWTDYTTKYGRVISGKPWGQIGQAAPQYTNYYRGKIYGCCADGDIWVLHYRKDLLEDPKEKDGFKTKYGYDLSVDTLEHYRDACLWFTRPEQNLYGTANLRSKSYGFWWWMFDYFSQASPNAYFFDDDMKPLLTSPEGLAATKLYASFKPASHPDITNWTFTEAVSSFVGGGQFSTIAWPSYHKFFIDPAMSKLKLDQVGAGLVPGTMVNGKLNRRSIYCYGAVLMGWAHGQADKEAAYCLAQWLTSPEIHGRTVAQPGILDPILWADLNNPLLQKAYQADFLKVFADNFKIAAPEIMLQGSGEYSQQLDSHVQEVWTGSKTPEDAMQATSDAWEEITNRLGRDTLKEVWKITKTYYPTVDTSATAGLVYTPLTD